MPLIVTFDSNVYRRVVRPEQFSKDPRHGDFCAISEAIRAGRIKPFFSSTIATLEAIKRSDRSEYFRVQTLQLDFKEQPMPDGSIRARVTVSPDNEKHPGFAPPFGEALHSALELGFRFLPCPRLGHPQPEIVRNSTYQATTDMAYLEAWSDIANEIENAGYGFSVAKGIGERILAREGFEGRRWSEALDKIRDLHEEREFSRAVEEWADGDTVAAHLAYHSDVLCTEDIGRSSGAPSILGKQGRNWIKSRYPIAISNIENLAQRFSE